MMKAFELEIIYVHTTTTIGRYINHPLIFVAKDHDGTLYMCHLIHDKEHERQLKYIGIELTKELGKRIEGGLSIPDAYLEAKEIYEVQASQLEPIRAWPTEDIYAIKERISQSITKKRNNHE